MKDYTTFEEMFNDDEMVSPEERAQIERGVKLIGAKVRLKQACREVKLMREGKLPKRSWEEFKERMTKENGESPSGFRETLNEQLKNPEFKKEWDLIQPELENIRAECENFNKQRQTENIS